MSAISGNEKAWARQTARVLTPAVAWLLAVQAADLAVGYLGADWIARVPAALAAFARVTHRMALAGGLVWLFARGGRAVEAWLLASAAREHAGPWEASVRPILGRAARQILPLVALILGVPSIVVSSDLAEAAGQVSSLLLIGGIALILVQIVHALAEVVEGRHPIDVEDNGQARAVRTQVVVLRKAAVALVVVVALASMLMVFGPVRQFGASILASAGIAGIIIGVAAQRSIGTLLAGFQIALTQPVRVDDVVVVDGEWGRIEEISLTYVVVRIWDQRCLILPITRFIEQSFENWTRSAAEIMGTVVLHVDYTLPLDALRAELARCLAASPLWDGRVGLLQVTGAGEHTLEVRALISAADSGRAWDLRCEVRERLVTFVQTHHPQSLPRLRASIDAAPDGTGTAAVSSEVRRRFEAAVARG